MVRPKHWLPKLLKVITREPFGVISLCISTTLGILSSPFLADWYSGPNVVAEVHTFRARDQGSCGDWKLVIWNNGRRTAKNVRIQFDVDHFTSRGDIEGYYSGDEPLLRVVKKVDFKSDLRLLLIPELPPGVQQEFIYIETVIDADTYARRVELSLERTKEVDRLPRVSLVTTDDGLATVRRKTGSPPCQ